MSFESKPKSLLFSPVTLRGVTLKNRIGATPMCQYSAVDGFVNDWHLVNVGSFATGGAGIVFVEATAVEARGRITPECVGIWKDEHIEPMARLAKFVKSQGAVAAIQIGHAGRKASTYTPWKGRDSIPDSEGGWETIGASPIAFGGTLNKVPKEATQEDIDQITASHVSAAQRAVKAGFQLIELHFAHGYLVSTFLSPLTNLRSDKYGGSLENRMRLGLQIAEAVRNALPEEVPLGVRVSVTDYAANGWDIDQSIEFAEELKKLNIDYLDCSSGGVLPVQYPDTAEVQTNAAIRIAKESAIKTVAVGKIVDPLQAEKILKGGATIVLLGRAMLNNPHWPYYAADVLGESEAIAIPSQYNWCIGWVGWGSKWRKEVANNNNINTHL